MDHLKVQKAASTKKQFQKFWIWTPTHCRKQNYFSSQEKKSKEIKMANCII